MDTAATQHDDDTTTTSNTQSTITTTPTAPSLTTATTGGGDLDLLFNVESTLPEMNWDRLEEQLRNALQLERRATEVLYETRIISSVQFSKSIL